MVWDAAVELSGPVVFRWYRSVWTDLQPVTLTLSHPFTVLDLRWNPVRTAYESRPVVLSCGRFSATLRVNGVTRPLAPFRVTRFTFEVLLFLSDDVGAADEPDLPRYVPHLGGYIPGRLRAAAAAELAVLQEPLSPTTAALERQHRQLVTRLAGVALLGELSADVRQLRRQTSANGRQVQALARELHQERLQRRLAEAVRREVARLRVGSPRRGQRGSGAATAGRPSGRIRRRPSQPAPQSPSRAKDSEEWEDVPDSPPPKTSTTDTIEHHVAFDEAATGKEVKETVHGLETAEAEKDFAFEDLCREDCQQTEPEVKTEKDVLRELAGEPMEDEDELDLGGPSGSEPDLYETDLDLSHVPGSPPFVRYRTVGGAEVTVRPAPNQPTRKEGLQLLRPWRPWYPSDLTSGQRAAVLTGGQVIRGDISHIWTSAGQTLVNIETNGWEDVIVPFEKVLMVW